MIYHDLPGLSMFILATRCAMRPSNVEDLMARKAGHFFYPPHSRDLPSKISVAAKAIRMQTVSAKDLTHNYTAYPQSTSLTSDLDLVLEVKTVRNWAR